MRRDFRWTGLSPSGAAASDFPLPPLPADLRGSLPENRGSLGSLFGSAAPEAPPGRGSLGALGSLGDAVRREGGPLFPGSAPPACTACGAVLFMETDIICPGCYAKRRPSRPGSVVPFDPGRRLRSIARLSGRVCGDCGSVDWYVNPRGDATCRTCARRRAGGAA